MVVGAIPRHTYPSNFIQFGEKNREKDTEFKAK
jgi:hypothetical protein